LQPPQFIRSELVAVSQPLRGLPSQSANPAPQTGTHAPLRQLVEPLELLQAMPQPPQLAMSASRLASQPLVASPSQLPNPVAQLIAQVPWVQAAVPLVELQRVPQSPQWLVLVWRSVSQPFCLSPSQSPKLALQVGVQAPAVQLEVPFGFTHSASQAPQCLEFVASSISQPLPAFLSQSAKPDLHDAI
jgi:hypothetical protein